MTWKLLFYGLVLLLLGAAGGYQSAEYRARHAPTQVLNDLKGMDQAIRKFRFP